MAAVRSSSSRRLAAPRLRGTITLSGPFFRRDPGATFADNVQTMMEAVAGEGQADLVARIASIPPAGVRTGERRRRVRGRVRSGTGKHWRVTAVIGIPNQGMTRPEAIRTYAALAKIETLHHPIRGTATALKRSRKVNAAELTKGL